ncbi:MAG: hypothetical protein Q9226_005251 [Calogaya cf. arnoldii]
MGVRGYLAWRFRKRYYVMIRHASSQPHIFGPEIADLVPKDEKDYQAWLAAERQRLASLEAGFVTSLEVGSGFQPQRIDYGGIRRNWFIPCSDEFVWIYILDLDNEVFSINNSAHLKLDCVPHVDWLEAPFEGAFRDKIFVPSLVPKGAIKTLVAPLAVRYSSQGPPTWFCTSTDNLLAGQCSGQSCFSVVSQRRLGGSDLVHCQLLQQEPR